MGVKKKDCISVKALVLRHRQEIASFKTTGISCESGSLWVQRWSADLPVRGSIPVERTSPFIGKQGSNTNILSL